MVNDDDNVMSEAEEDATILQAAIDEIDIGIPPGLERCQQARVFETTAVEVSPPPGIYLEFRSATRALSLEPQMKSVPVFLSRDKKDLMTSNLLAKGNGF